MEMGHPFHVVAVHEGSCCGERRGGGGIDEVLLHFARGGEGDEKVRGRAGGGKGVRNAARGEDGIAGAKVETLVPDLEGHLAVHDVKPFLLAQMHMQCRS